MYLIERLEADRQYAEEALREERRRKRILESEVDSIALWRQREHALAVQEGLRQRLHHAGFHCQNNESNALFHSLYIFVPPSPPPPPEHQACVQGVTELKRQLALDGGKLEQAQEKLSDAEVLNQRLHQEISSAQTQMATVTESLELQRGIISGVKVAQAEVRRVASQQTGFGFASHFSGRALDSSLLYCGLIFCL